MEQTDRQTDGPQHCSMPSIGGSIIIVISLLSGFAQRQLENGVAEPPHHSASTSACNVINHFFHTNVGSFVPAHDCQAYSMLRPTACCAEKEFMLVAECQTY